MARMVLVFTAQSSEKKITWRRRSCVMTPGFGVRLWVSPELGWNTGHE